ncbi:MAG: hypothetical protein R2754_15950 [Microthrixaceae bacterium]
MITRNPPLAVNADLPAVRPLTDDEAQHFADGPNSPALPQSRLAPLVLLAVGLPAAVVAAWSLMGAFTPTAADQAIQDNSYFYFLYRPMPSPGVQLSVTLVSTVALGLATAAAVRGLASHRLDRGWLLVMIAEVAAAGLVGAVVRVLMAPTMDGVWGVFLVISCAPAVALLGLFATWRTVVLVRKQRFSST